MITDMEEIRIGNAMVGAFMRMSIDYLKEEDYDRALEFLQKAQELHRIMSRKIGVEGDVKS